MTTSANEGSTGADTTQGDAQGQDSGTGQQQTQQGTTDAGGEPKSPYANIEATPENIAELASTRDKLREKNREMAARLAEFEAAQSEAAKAARQAAEEKARAEGDFKTLLQQREQDLQSLNEQLEAYRSKADAMAAEVRRRDMMEVMSPELRPGVSRFLVDAAISELERKGIVEAQQDADPKDLGRAYLTALAKHSPELLKGSDPGGAPGQQPNGTPRIDVAKLNQALGGAQIGSRAARLLGR